MMQNLTITTLAVLAALWAAPTALGDMAGKSEDHLKRATGASASAAASSSSSTSGGSGAEDCRSTARASASASASGKESYDSDEEIQETSSGGCSARAHSRATVSTTGKKVESDND